MADPADGVVLVLTTLASEDDAERLVRSLVDERLIACGNVMPGITSIYRWQGAVEREAEVMVLMKTTGSRVDAALERASELHPYEVPELLTVMVDGGTAPYRRWVREETSKVSE